MAIHLGPVLGFRGATRATWKTSALVVTDDVDGPPTLTLTGMQNVAVQVTRLLVGPGALVAWRLDWEVPRAKIESAVQYEISGQGKHGYFVPGQGTPLRLAYGSCNGFSDPKLMKSIEVKNERWDHLHEQHSLHAYHLLLLGGDQVYGDELWQQPDSNVFSRWLSKGRNLRRKTDFGVTMRVFAERFYFELYVSRWRQKEVARVLASIPTLMAWDDHDTFDGWGSYPAADQSCPVYLELGRIARRHYRVFQLQEKDVGETAPGRLGTGESLAWGHRIDDIAILGLDLRSERTRESVVMSETAWKAATGWLATQAKGARHLLVLSSVPVVYPRFTLLENLLGAVPGQQELEDDLRDHWTSPPHEQERVRLVHQLLDHSHAEKCRVTILSGDVHVGALGEIVSVRNPERSRGERVISQLISSAIVHPPPPKVARLFLQLSGDKEDRIDGDIAARMTPFTGAGADLFVFERNWLALEFDKECQLWAKLWAENRPDPLWKVIHPI